MADPKRLNRGNTGLLIIDMQERLLPVMENKEELISNTIKLIEGFKILEGDIFYTEQYPKGLGYTDTSIKNALGERKSYEKTSFSCAGAGNLLADFASNKLENIVICGIESHICVQQTYLDLKKNGFDVFLVTDAISSRKKIDYETSLKRAQANQIELITTESVLFELLKESGTEAFKAISKLIK
ncbi:MAG: isochorismatase family protein [Rhodothermaceae bacterium]